MTSVNRNLIAVGPAPPGLGAGGMNDQAPSDAPVVTQLPAASTLVDRGSVVDLIWPHNRCPVGG